MFDRAYVKGEAKKLLRKNFKIAILMCIISFVLLGNIKYSYRFNIKVDSSYKYTEDKKDNTFLKKGYIINLDGNALDKNFIEKQNSHYANSSLISRLGNGFLLLFSVKILIILGILRLIISILMSPISLGQSRAFMDVYKTGEELDIRKLFSYFKGGNYWRIVANLVLKNLVISLFSLLLIVPGIYKNCQYYFVDYILSDDPSLSFSEAVDISKSMTDGIKWDIFIFDISFIGWVFVSVLTFGLGFFILYPYIEASVARLYLEVKDNKAHLLDEINN